MFDTGVYFTAVPEIAVTTTATTDVSSYPALTPTVTSTPIPVITAAPTSTESPSPTPSLTPSADTPIPVMNRRL